MRVLAIWQRNRYVWFGLVAVNLSLSSVCVVSIAKVPAQQDVFGEDLHSTYGVCPPYFASSSAINTCFLVLVAYESVLLTLTLVKAIDMYRHLQVGTSGFIDIFFVDGLSYNGFILAGSTANIIVRYKTAPTEYINLLTSLQPVFHSVLTSRMMLHLKQNAIMTRQNSMRSFVIPYRHGCALSEAGDCTPIPVDHGTSWFRDGLRPNGHLGLDVNDT
ncbi:hypothetical protein L218DRAFT_866292 [Marasmius fiardii PR-910]|nr:hypothetical protein L218DRAFT_866292 [Marasmius fiardii PR-910]